MARAYGIGAVVLVAAVTVLLGAYGLRISRTTSDFFVASRAVTPWWNASAIGGEYLSAASFLGVAGLVLASGADALWYPVGYTAGYLVLLVLVAAPLRRSGAYTLPDFAEARMESRAVRRVASVLVVLIGWLYLLPQLVGAGLTLRVVTGAPTWVGPVVVAAVVLVNVVAGGMRSITLVQGFQFWLKLVALAFPLAFLLAVWHSHGSPAPHDDAWLRPLHGHNDHPLYTTYSLMLALLFGTMGLPHVLVRFYTNPEGRAARRTTLAVLALLGTFYLLPTVYGFLGRLYTPDLARTGDSDAAVLLLPGRLIDGMGGRLLAALVVAGAFAAFLSTSSGLTVSVAGVLSQDLLRGEVRDFRIATLIATAVPLGLAPFASGLEVADVVGLAFAVAASSFCPLLVLGIWWRRLTVPGAITGLVVGGGLAASAVITTLVRGHGTGWPGELLGQPAAWTVPLAFAVMCLVSVRTPSSRPVHVDRTMVRLHLPESLAPAHPATSTTASRSLAADTD